MKLYCAIDLHSTNNVVVVIDEHDKVLFQQRLPNDLQLLLTVLAPFKADLHGIAIESTFNWYWLVDGLLEADYPVMLVNTVAVKQYSGLKHTDDESDAFWLAHLMRLGILPTGYIYPKDPRAVRDLLRKRLQLVRDRVTHITTGRQVAGKAIKRLDLCVSDFIDNGNVRLAIDSNLTLIGTLNRQIERIEAAVKRQVMLKPAFQSLLTIDGIGEVLGMTIALETGDIRRFPQVGNFSSYCRCVDSKRLSNGKQKGANNQRNGNKYLAWAFVEAAHSIIRHNKTAHRFYQRKRAQKNGALATKALAHKLARAAYYVMRDQVPFRPERLFQ